jgi:hypothetical protein
MDERKILLDMIDKLSSTKDDGEMILLAKLLQVEAIYTLADALDNLEKRLVDLINKRFNEIISEKVK